MSIQTMHIEKPIYNKETITSKPKSISFTSILDQILKKYNLSAESNPSQLRDYASELGAMLLDWKARKSVKEALRRRLFKEDQIKALVPDKRNEKLTIKERAQYCAKSGDPYDIYLHALDLFKEANSTFPVSEADFILYEWLTSYCNSTSAADLLRKASGIFAYITENISPRWENPPNSRPLDVLTEISTSLSKIALADASSIAIRKALMQQKSSSLLAKLAIGVAVEYESANGLLNSLKDPQKVCGNFRKYVSNGALFHQITFDTVPSRADLQALIPGGRIVQELTKYSKPDPAFGPYKEQQIESAALNSLPFVSYFAN
ncbi:17785_t:CDS:2 [Entrophospora sp. SA101]|nr:17785_t:CDS:2 [Entrophospora sp. SA101]